MATETPHTTARLAPAVLLLSGMGVIAAYALTGDRIRSVEGVPHAVVTGACLLIRRAAYEQIGGFDEDFFMYSEELDYCRRARAAGWRVHYLPAARVIHFEGKSSEQALPERHIRFQRSKIRYFRKYHGPLAASVLRLFLLASYAQQLALEALKALLGHKREMRRARVRTYGQVLRALVGGKW